MDPTWEKLRLPVQNREAYDPPTGYDPADYENSMRQVDSVFF